MAKFNILYTSEMGNAIGIADNKSYFNFCGAGKKVDARMAELFANRILKRQDCDRSIVGADEWAELAIEKLGY